MVIRQTIPMDSQTTTMPPHASSHVHDGKADAASDSNEHRVDAVVMSSDLFAGQLQSEPPSPDWQNANVTKEPSLADLWQKELSKKDVAKRDALSE